jgi:demethoxyubiquinone hydroxylase (CLK1/Coq7/Cat5 family)
MRTQPPGDTVFEPAHRDQLVAILRAAYSGELAAGYAYRGHWKSVSSQLEREGIRKIENDEWVHRRRVGEMLDTLGSRPSTIRELRMWLTGRAIGALCHVIGWFLPMYFAGRLESRNVEEYEEAAVHAGALELKQFESELRMMRSIEREHELFFLNAVAGHRLLPLVQPIFKWGSPDGLAEPANTSVGLDAGIKDEAYKRPLSGEGD